MSPRECRRCPEKNAGPHHEPGVLFSRSRRSDRRQKRGRRPRIESTDLLIFSHGLCTCGDLLPAKNNRKLVEDMLPTGRTNCPARTSGTNQPPRGSPIGLRPYPVLGTYFRRDVLLHGGCVLHIGTSKGFKWSSDEEDATAFVSHRVWFKVSTGGCSP